MNARFDPGAVEFFEFTRWSWREDGALELHYRLDPGPAFVEVVEFEGAPPLGDPDRLARRARLVHLLAGVSYYKTACPGRLLIRYPADDELIAFVAAVYRHGLGEFAFENGIDIGERLDFVVDADGAGELPPPEPEVSGGVVVPIGGGKDSLVSLDLLQTAGIPLQTIAVGSAALIDQVVDRLGTAHIRIRRRLDPTLFELNTAGALNGHVPISAILAAIMVCGAGRYGYDTMVMSNERSAEAGNVVDAAGNEVNHQYSKTLAFERAFARVLDQDAPGVRYFSLLRPWSELAIARYFARLTGSHDVFSSCNRNFRLRSPADRRWCNDCPKCRFVFLVLAPFLEREALLAIFGGVDLLDQPGQQDGFEALLGLGDHKPFECVGEIDECRAAFTLLRDRPEWRDRALVRALAPRIERHGVEPWLTAAKDHAVPGAFLAAAMACGDA
ncbi:MAG: endonuclease domain-containing protein [Pseudomonadota bacterium]